MLPLLKHNLTAGWRNIKKYKAQNVISVLCLSVGVLCFAVTLYFANIIWYNVGTYLYNDNLYDVKMQDRDGAYKYDYSREEIQKIKRLPSIESVVYESDDIVGVLSTGKSVGRKRVNSSIVSSDWLSVNSFRSYATGDIVGEQKAGTAVIGRKLAERLYPKAEQAIGREVVVDGMKYTISGVVYSRTYIGKADKVFVVKDNAQMVNMRVIGKSGYTAKQMRDDINSAFYPKYTCDKNYKEDYRVIMLFATLCVVLLGSGILVMSVTGYLKMLLQLFTLRGREMALRRCNGASSWQLFQLLCAELFIFFAFVAVISVALSYVFQFYFVPFLTAITLTDWIDFMPAMIHKMCVWVVVLTFFVSVLIAWLTVKDTLRSPLAAEVKPNSYRHTWWNKAMQVVQYTVAMLLFGVMVAMIYSFNSALNIEHIHNAQRLVQMYEFGYLLSVVVMIVGVLCVVMTVYSTIALDTRGRQKEIAIRKVNGAKRRDIVMMFARYYIVTLSVSFAISFVFLILLSMTGRNQWSLSYTAECVVPYLVSAMMVAGITAVTVWNKINAISKVNPSMLIKKE